MGLAGEYQKDAATVLKFPEIRFFSQFYTKLVSHSQTRHCCTLNASQNSYTIKILNDSKQNMVYCECFAERSKEIAQF